MAGVGHRGVVVPPGPRARHGRRARHADGRRRHRHLHAGQRASRPVLRLPEFLRHAGLRAARHGARAPGRALRRARPRRHASRQASSTSSPPPAPATRSISSTASCSAGRARLSRAALRRRRALRPATTRSSGSTTGRSASTRVDCLTTRDYLWRWDTDWFWCSKNVGAQHPLLRRLFGRERLNSVTYTKIMRWNSRVRHRGALDRLRGTHVRNR